MSPGEMAVTPEHRPGDRRPGRAAMDVSVVVCTSNRARLLAGLFDALAVQRTPPGTSWETVVVDNNSRDDTRRVVEGRAPALPVRVHYVFEPRQGLSCARNTGIAAATGRIVAFTDDDARPAPDWVAMIVEAIDRGPADVTGGRIVLEWPGPVPAWLQRDPRLQRILGRLETDHAHAITTTAVPPDIWGTNMAFRREVFAAIGGFDSRLGLVGTTLYRGEETALIAAAVQAGKRVVFDPRLVVRHHVVPERMRRSYFRRYYFDTGEQKALLARATPRRQVLGLPPWRVRRTLRALGRWLGALLSRRPDAFRRELHFRFALGYLHGCRRTLGRGASGR